MTIGDGTGLISSLFATIVLARSHFIRRLLDINAISYDMVPEFAVLTFSFFYSYPTFSLVLLGHEAFSGSSRRVHCFLLT